jgi:hypothetical protein
MLCVLCSACQSTDIIYLSLSLSLPSHPRQPPRPLRHPHTTTSASPHDDTSLKHGLDRNHTLKEMPIPLLDVSEALRDKGTSHLVQGVVGQLEDSMRRNASPKSKFDQSSGGSGASAMSGQLKILVHSSFSVFVCTSQPPCSCRAALCPTCELTCGSCSPLRAYCLLFALGSSLFPSFLAPAEHSPRANVN